MQPTVSKPLPPPPSPPSRPGQESPVSMRSVPLGSSPNSSPIQRCDGLSVVAGPSGCQPAGTSPQRQPTPEEPSAPVYQPTFPEDVVPSLPDISPSPPTQLRLARLSINTISNRHLSTNNPSLVLPLSSKRRPSIPIEDFPTSPTDDEWEDFSFEEDIIPVSPTRRHTVRRRPSGPLSPRLVKGASLTRSHASRRSRRNRFTAMNARSPTSPINNFSHIPSIYSTYSYYDLAQLDAALDDRSEIVQLTPESPEPVAPQPKPETEPDDYCEVPGGSNLDPRGSVSSVSTVRPLIGQRNHSRLGGLREKFRWFPGRSGSGQDSSSDESVLARSSLDNSSIEGVDVAPCRPSYNRACTTSYTAAKQSTTGKSVVFSKPGFKSARGTKQGSSDFKPGHGYQSSTDSSSYAASFSSFEKNLRIGGTACSTSSCGSEGSPCSKQRPLSSSRASSVILPAEEPKNITGPPVPSHVRSRSHNFQYPRPRTVKSFETLRQPKLREKNNVPHHPFPASVIPYPLAYSPAMMAADRWNHALLFGDERNSANAGGLLRGSTTTVSFSQFYGVGSGRKEVLKGKELRGGKVLDLGCGEGLWVLSAAKEWKYTRFVGFDLMPVQMNLEERLQGVKNASEIIDRIEWINGDCLNAPLPFDDNSFDLVRLANMTLALPTDPEADNWRLRALFSEIFRVLKVDGELEVIDENHVVPSASTASPSHPDHKAFDSVTGLHCNQLEKAFENMLTYNRLSAYPVIPELLKQHFSTSTEKAHFRLAVSPDANVVDRLTRRDGMSDETATRVELDCDLGLVEGLRPESASLRGRSRSGSIQSTRNRKMLQLLGKEFAESRRSAPPTGLIVMPNKMLPLSQAAVYAHATHSTNVLLAAKEQLFEFVELCAQGRGVADRQDFEDLLWQYESSRFDRLGLRDPFQTFNDWDTGVSDMNEGLCSNELRSPKYACTTTSSPPLDAQSRVAATMGPLPAWRYESESDVVTVREIRVCLARKTSQDAPVYNPPPHLWAQA